MVGLTARWPPYARKLPILIPCSKVIHGLGNFWTKQFLRDVLDRGAAESGYRHGERAPEHQTGSKHEPSCENDQIRGDSCSIGKY